METGGGMSEGHKNLWECMQQKYAVPLHVNFCLLHAKMPIKTETNFLIAEFYISSVTKTVKPIQWFCMSKRTEMVQRFPA